MYWSVPLILGVCAIVQAGLNEKMAAQIGLNSTAALSSVHLLVVAAAIATLAILRPYWVSSEISNPDLSLQWHWWYLIPGILGYFLVAGLPFAYTKLGANTTMVLLISAQIVASLVWDWQIGNRDITITKIIGSLVAVAGAVILWSAD